MKDIGSTGTSTAHISNRLRRKFGAQTFAGGTMYRAWFPDDASIEVRIWSKRRGERTLKMDCVDEGFHTIIDELGEVGDEYLFKRNGGEGLLPDPASYAFNSVTGRSVVASASGFLWQDGSWQRPDFRDLVIYELHVGTFTEKGTYTALREKLSHMKDLGVNAIEIMPIATFRGDRNWGYDGIMYYAPAACYGSPDELRKLVNEAHQQGLAVILDVVYNHLGPDGDYLPACTKRFFNSSHQTPWGDGFNFDGEHCGPVRDFFIGNMTYWIEDFHIDGFRLDATHAIRDESSVHILSEMAQAAERHGCYILAEDERNERKLLEQREHGGLQFNAVWADDFHHTLRVSLGQPRHAYFSDYSGTTPELAQVLRCGWLYQGQLSASSGHKRGTPCQDLPPSKFIHSISNHDQVGNRAMGERVSALVPAEAYRALSALICLTPYTPMLFMGQEWAASTPFLFFSSFKGELGRLVTEGRRKEFASFPEFQDEQLRDQIPDPEAESTFHRSKLIWEETRSGTHAEVLRLYQQCLQLRHRHRALRPLNREAWKVQENGSVVQIHYEDSSEELILIIHMNQQPHQLTLVEQAELSGEENSECTWALLLSSQQESFGGPGCLFNPKTQTIKLIEHEVILMHRTKNRSPFQAVKHGSGLESY